MNIAFLHIGDLHIKDKHGVNVFQIKKIVDTLNNLPAISHVVIVVAGDISFNGKTDQYCNAKYVLGNLITAIKRNGKDSSRIHVVCVPGNHDVDHNGKPMTSEELQKIRKANLYDSKLAEELDKQSAFFSFAKFNKCFEDKSILHQRIIDCSGFKIEINMINSAVFSILEEDKGLHYIPTHSINSISTPTGADFVVTVMHHAPDWYIDEQKNALEEAVYGKSSIVFLGHEHVLRKKTIQLESYETVFVQAGGCLCQNEDWATSAFHIGLLDTETLTYSDIEYVWNVGQNQYEKKNYNNIDLPNKPSEERPLRVTNEYQTILSTDNKHDICRNYLDYFVFPRIQSDERIGSSRREFTDETHFINELLSRKRVLITGPYNSGKTTLLKTLFSLLNSKGYTVLLCNIDTIRGNNSERIIKNCFEDIYGSAPSDYNRFEQMPKSQKVLIIDDIDQIQNKSFESFMAYIDARFDTIVFSSKQVLDMSLVERMKTQLKAVDSVARYEIMPIFADKRMELVTRVVTILVPDSVQRCKTITTLVDTINAQRRFILLDPDFIIKYVECYCKNIGDISTGESGVFSKVFEASLVNAISEYQTERFSVDKVFLLLSKIAHFIHFHKAYPVSAAQIDQIINQYNEEYGASVDSHEFLSIVTCSRILNHDPTVNAYRFVNKNYLAYFVARELVYQYNLTGDDTNLQSILRYACFGINADILLFVSYITDNIRILRLILRTANEYTKTWSEFDFDTNLPQFLSEERTHSVALPASNTRESEQKAEVAAERDADNIIQTLDIYDYSDDDADKLLNQIIRSVSLLVIVARCLPNFEHSMLKSDKEQFIEAIYVLPNKIFELWANETDREIDSIIQFFRDQSQEYYIRQKKASDEDIIRALQWAAMSLLLELYDLPVYYATKSNTIGYLSSFNYTNKSTYELEHLMMLERHSSPNDFVSELFRLGKEKTGLLYSTLIKRVASHALVYNSALDRTHVQRIQSKFFPDGSDHKKLLVQRLQTSKES